MNFYLLLGAPFAMAFVLRIIERQKFLHTNLWSALFLVSQITLVLYSKFFNIQTLLLFVALFSSFFFFRRRNLLASLFPFGFFCIIWIGHKYFFGESEWLKTIADPAHIVGTSYMAFKLIAFGVEFSSDSKVQTMKYLDFMCWLFFVPTIVAGPIQFSQQWTESRHKNRDLMNDFSLGFLRFFVGVVKTFVLSDLLLGFTTQSMGYSDIFYSSLLQFLAGSALYCWYIYLNFAGYSDMAIGLGKFFGIDVPENFDWPFFKRNLQLFWKSWHMSLINWLNKFVFNPITMSGARHKRFASLVKNLPVYCGLLATFILAGIWHAWSLSYFLWGLSSALGLCFLVYAKPFTRPKTPFWKWWQESWIPKILATAMTFCFVTLTFIPVALGDVKLGGLFEKYGIRLGLITCPSRQALFNEKSRILDDRENKCLLLSLNQ